jgi:hypothetical protein
MFTAFGIVLLIGGAVLTFAVDREAEGVDLDTIGWILMAGGAASLLIGAIAALGWATARRRHGRAERHLSPDGRHVVEETSTT